MHDLSVQRSTFENRRAVLLPPAFRYFQAIVDSGSIQGAARNLLVAPSALSRHLASLERELGVTLFERRSTGMVVTAAGMRVYEYVSRSRSELSLLRNQLGVGEGDLAGTISIACIEGVIPSLLPKWIAQARQVYPNVRIDVAQQGSIEVVSSVINGTADFGFTFGQSTRTGLNFAGVVDTPIRLFVGKNHPLYGVEKCTLADLEQIEMILPAQTFGLRREVELAFAAADIPLRVQSESSSLRLCLEVVALTELATFSTPVTVSVSGHGKLPIGGQESSH